MLQTIISKSQFKPQVLEYLRMVEQNKQPLTITHAGKPVVQIVPYKKTMKDARTVEEARARLKGSVLSYIDPMEPVGLDDWEALK